MGTSFKRECWELLNIFLEALLPLQRHTPGQSNHGAIWDPSCHVFHTRAAEAVFPLAVAHKQHRDERLLSAAICLGNWLLTQQDRDGSWPETPEDWRATTTDQLLSLSCALPLIEPALSARQRELWRQAIMRAADFLMGHIHEGNVHVNYLATTAASLSASYVISGIPAHLRRASALARLVVSRYLNADGLLEGEGHRAGGRLYGVDVGYNLDMTLWGLALYAQLTGDRNVAGAAASSLAAHLPFIYPDGSLDNSWGVRSCKWTVYGSLTAHGAPASLSLLGAHDARFLTAAQRMLGFLRKMHQAGLVGYGPHHFLRSRAACLYPTFARACALALCIEYGAEHADTGARLPCDVPSARLFPSVQVALLRTQGVMATVSGYTYKAPGDAAHSKYMSRPSGGAVTALWFKGAGFLQAASQGRYRRWEELHFPPHPSVPPLGPRIEASRLGRRWSSLYEYDAKLELISSNPPTVVAAGTVRGPGGRPGPLHYRWTHCLLEQGIRKEVILHGGGLGLHAQIIEPIIADAETKIIQASPCIAYIEAPRSKYKLTLLSEDAVLSCGAPDSRYGWPVPALQAIPVCISVGLLPKGSRRQLAYQLERLPSRWEAVFRIP